MICQSWSRTIESSDYWWNRKQDWFSFLGWVLWGGLLILLDYVWSKLSYKWFLRIFSCFSGDSVSTNRFLPSRFSFSSPIYATIWIFLLSSSWWRDSRPCWSYFKGRTELELSSWDLFLRNHRTNDKLWWWYLQFIDADLCDIDRYFTTFTKC